MNPMTELLKATSDLKTTLMDMQKQINEIVTYVNTLNREFEQHKKDTTAHKI